MKIIQAEVRGAIRAGILSDDGTEVDLAPGGVDPIGLVKNPDSARDGERVKLNECTLKPAVNPNSIRDFISFEQHIVGCRNPDPIYSTWYTAPRFYFTNPNSIHADGDEVRTAPNSLEFDVELEVAAVIGTDLFNPSSDEARQAIVGYCIMADWSARDLQREDVTSGLGPSKAKDTAMTLGPYLVSADEFSQSNVEGFFDAAMSLTINGVEVGRDNLNQSAWTFPEMISYAGRGTWLRSGDVFGSGTCGGGCIRELRGWAGTSAPAPRYLRPGDEVRLAVEGLGTLTNRVISPVTAHDIPPARRRPYSRPEIVTHY